MCIAAPLSNSAGGRSAMGALTGGWSRIGDLASGRETDVRGTVASVASGGVADIFGLGPDVGHQKAVGEFLETDKLNPPPSADGSEEAKLLKLPRVVDEEQRRARAAQMLRSLSGRGRASSFLTGPQGATGSSSKPAAGGY